MGMFDNIICEAPLPDGFNDPAHMDFQTKDMECELATFTITEDGKLVCGRLPTRSPLDWLQPKVYRNKLSLRSLAVKENAKNLRLQRRIKKWEAHQGKSAGGHYGKCPGSRKKSG